MCLRLNREIPAEMPSLHSWHGLKSGSYSYCTIREAQLAPALPTLHSNRSPTVSLTNYQESSEVFLLK